MRSDREEETQASGGRAQEDDKNTTPQSPERLCRKIVIRIFGA